MAVSMLPEKSFANQILSGLRRFFRWLTDPKVALALIMLALMIYLIIIPLYRMLVTTVTFQAKDLITHPNAVEGQFTLYHWGRMLSSKISAIMLYAPLQHSLVVSVGATAIALILGCFMAWF